MFANCSNPTALRPGALLGAIAVMAATLQSHAADFAPALVVGVTPTCPYGITGCAGAAREALGRLKGVEVVASTPDAYNCTFELRLTQPALPDLRAWREQFRNLVGEAFIFRGLEVTFVGKVVSQDRQLAVESEALEQPLRLAPLVHKLQWNFRKHAGREPEPQELAAYSQLARAVERDADASFEITGPLHETKDGLELEVREFYVSRGPKPSAK